MIARYYQEYTVRRILSAALAFLFVSNSGAMPSAQNHTELWLACIGAKSTNPARMEFLKLSEIIDTKFDGNALKEKLKQAMPTVSAKLPLDFNYNLKLTSPYYHRRVFHWGLSCSPEGLSGEANADPLRKLVDECLGEMNALNQSELQQLRLAVYNAFGEQWRELQSRFVVGTQRIFPSDALNPSSRVSPVAVVIYEIHIIADYMDKQIFGLGSFDIHFERELLEQGLQSFPPSPRRDQLVKDLKHAYARNPPISAKELETLVRKTPEEFSVNVARYLGEEDETRRRALHLLLILQEQLPFVLDATYPKAMAELGIAPKEDASLWSRFGF
jgi:hypothetical protein